MKEQINKKIRDIVESGDYISKKYYEIDETLRARMDKSNYHYCVTTADNIFHFTSKEKSFSLPLKDFDWRILWDKLGNIPTNSEDELEESFEHFESGIENTEVWHWFEWMFDITLGKELDW